MQQVNRLESEMKQWEAREQRFAKLFSPSILHSPAFKKEKLHHLRELRSRYRWAGGPDERFAGKLLLQERRQLEKELYPNRLKRNFFRLLGSLDRLARAAVLPPKRAIDLKGAEQGLQRASFGGLAKQLRQKAGEGNDTFTLHVARKANEGGQLDFRPEFSKGQDGRVRYNGHTVSLTGNGKTVSCRMDADMERLPEKKAYNLLSGRSVLAGGEWLSLDANDKDAKGNLRLKRMAEQQGIDLERELSKLPLRENRFAVAKDELVNRLKNGDKVRVNTTKKGRVLVLYLSSNGRGLDLFNAEGNKVCPEYLAGKKQGKNAGHGLSKGDKQTAERQMKTSATTAKATRLKH